MKILFLTPQLPYPPHKGTALRNFYLVKGVAANHEVHLLSFAEKPPRPEHLQTLHQYCASIQTVPAPHRSFRQRLASLLLSPLPDMALRLASDEFASVFRKTLDDNRFDAVQVEAIEMARYYLLIQGDNSLPPVIFDDHNAEYCLQRSAFDISRHQPRQWPGAIYSYIQWRRLERFELACCQRARKILAVSEDDRDALLSLDASLDITIVPNGVDVAGFDLAPKQGETTKKRPTLIFTGTMDYRPNVDAVTWFCHDILPMIQRSSPSVRFLIVGRNPSKAVQQLASSCVMVVGAVADINEYLAQADIYVVPMRMGSGVRFKVLEAMACGLPVVSTGFGLAGTGAEDGREALVAENPQDFAAKVIKLITTPPLAKDLTSRARRLVETTFDWQVILPKLEEVYQGLD